MFWIAVCIWRESLTRKNETNIHERRRVGEERTGEGKKRGGKEKKKRGGDGENNAITWAPICKRFYPLTSQFMSH